MRYLSSTCVLVSTCLAVAMGQTGSDVSKSQSPHYLTADQTARGLLPYRTALGDLFSGKDKEGIRLTGTARYGDGTDFPFVALRRLDDSVRVELSGEQSKVLIATVRQQRLAIDVSATSHESELLRLLLLEMPDSQMFQASDGAALPIATTAPLLATVIQESGEKVVDIFRRIAVDSSDSARGPIVRTIIFDGKTKLCQEISYVRKTDDGSDVKVTTEFTDWRTSGGITYPRLIVQRVGDKELIRIALSDVQAQPILRNSALFSFGSTQE